jgi:hypothetical protein
METLKKFFVLVLIAAVFSFGIMACTSKNEPAPTESPDEQIQSEQQPAEEQPAEEQQTGEQPTSENPE